LAQTSNMYVMSNHKYLSVFNSLHTSICLVAHYTAK